MPTTPSWPKSQPGPDGFRFPSSYQDSFHWNPPINEEVNETSSAEKKKKRRSLTKIYIPASSSGYDSNEDSKGHGPPAVHESTNKVQDVNVDIEKENCNNQFQERMGFLEKTDDSGIDTKDGISRRRKRKIHWKKYCCIITVAVAVAVVLITSGLIFGIMWMVSKSNNLGPNNPSFQKTDAERPTNKITTIKPQVLPTDPPLPPKDNDQKTPVVAIKMRIDDEYVEKAENDSNHVVLWEEKVGSEHIGRGITYKDGFFKVSVTGHYNCESTLRIDTRLPKFNGMTGEIDVLHCIGIQGTNNKICSKDGVPVHAIRSSSVRYRLLHLTAGQKVMVSINKPSLITVTDDSNEFTMRLVYQDQK